MRRQWGSERIRKVAAIITALLIITALAGCVSTEIREGEAIKQILPPKLPISNCSWLVVNDDYCTPGPAVMKIYVTGDISKDYLSENREEYDGWIETDKSKIDGASRFAYLWSEKGIKPGDTLIISTTCNTKMNGF